MELLVGMFFGMIIPGAVSVVACGGRNMNLWKRLTMLAVSPMISALVGFVFAGLLLPPDPTGRGAPGDGFVLIMGTFYGMIIPSVFSVVAGGGMICRAVRHMHPK
jgi:hypothetical protein